MIIGVCHLLSNNLKTAFKKAETNAHAWKALCDALADEFDAMATVLIPVDKAARVLWLVHSDCLKELLQVYIRDEWYLKDIRERGLQSCRRKGYTTDLDFISEAEMNTTAYYKDFLQPMGIGGFIAILFVVNNQEWVAAIQFPKGILEPAHEKLQLVKEIRQGLEKASERIFRQIAEKWEAILTDFEELNRCAVLLDAAGNTVQMNECAKTKLTSFGFGNSLPSFLSADLKNEVQKYVQSFAGENAQTKRLNIANGEAYDLEASLDIIPETMKIFHSSTACLLTLTEIKSQDRKIHETLKNIYQLTETEIRLTKRILQGLKLKEASKQLNITEGNARQHLKKIFRKACVESQVQLVTKLLNQYVSSKAGSQNI